MFPYFLRFSLWLMIALPCLVVAILLRLTGDVNWVEFVFGWPAHNGSIGGIFPIIINTIIMIGSAVALAFSIALPFALMCNIYEFERSIALRTAIDFGASIPRLLWGVIGALVFGSVFGFGVSAATGILTLACLLAPIMASSFIEALASERKTFLLSSRAIGLSEYACWIHVILPAARPRLLLAVQAAVGRGLGDAAALYLTAGASSRLISSLDMPASTLAVQILVQLLEVSGGQNQAIASAVILLCMIGLVQTTMSLNRLNTRG